MDRGQRLRAGIGRVGKNTDRYKGADGRGARVGKQAHRAPRRGRRRDQRLHHHEGGGERRRGGVTPQPAATHYQPAARQKETKEYEVQRIQGSRPVRSSERSARTLDTQRHLPQEYNHARGTPRIRVLRGSPLGQRPAGHTPCHGAHDKGYILPLPRRSRVIWYTARPAGTPTAFRSSWAWRRS